MALGQSPKAQQRAQQAAGGGEGAVAATSTVVLPPIVPGVWQGKPPAEADFKAAIKKAQAEQASQQTAESPQAPEQPLAAASLASGPVTAPKSAKAAPAPTSGSVSKEGE